MDASTFQSGRDTQLKNFQKMYADLKTQYTTAVNDSLKEKDTTKRSALISQTLGINKQIAALINSFSGTIDSKTCNQNPGLKAQLSKDLDKYNKDYEGIQQGTSQLTGLQGAIKESEQKISETKSWFSWYAIMIGVLMLVLVYMVVTRVSSSSLDAQTSMPAASGSL